MFLSMHLDHQLFVFMVTLLFLLWDLVKAMGGGSWRHRRWMTHFNLFWNKQDDYFRKKELP